MKRTKRLLFLSLLLAIMSSVAEAQTNGMTNGHYWVDLGLPSGTLWATCNVGANSPEEYGDYFAWGETEPKEEYSSSNYFDKNGSKYNIDGGLMELLPEDDAATANWGNDWQMPNIGQMEELLVSIYTEKTWTTQNGVNGIKITSKRNGNSIFLPMAGEYNDDLNYTGLYGEYWTSSLSINQSNGANRLLFWFSSDYGYKSYQVVIDARLFIGLSIRPVRNSANTIGETTPAKGTTNGHEWVDMGLPSGAKWATCNLGANSPEEYGDYFAWGETEPKEEYSSSNYFDTENGGETFIRYNIDGGLMELLPEDDAATTNWGNDWQMPNIGQMEELLVSIYTEKTWTTQNGVNGIKITSKRNGNSIFLPMAGEYRNSLSLAGSYGEYWTSSLSINTAKGANMFWFSSDSGYKSYQVDTYGRIIGLNIRPVCKNPSDITDDDDLTSALAAEYLQGKGVIDGGDPNIAGNLLRQQLAKVAFRGVYSINGRTVPVSVPSDNYPTVYSDFPEEAYYYQAARALLYLEYDDDITPFDRNRFQFDPSNTIARVDVLKVLLETFDIKPDVSLSNPFPSDTDVSNMKSKDNPKYGYIAKAADLGIIKKPNNGQNTNFRPYDKCTRGEAFTMLARIMKKIEAGTITDPNPQDEDYFAPLNTTLATISLGASLPMGNFQHYTKSSFAMSGVVPLVFAHTYNSYNTTLPEVFYGINDNDETYQPLGDGWSHNYHTFISVPTGLDGTNTRLAVHWGGGSIDVYAYNGTTFAPVSYGVYDEMSLVNREIIIKTKSQMEYHFSALGGSEGGEIFYLVSVKDRNGNTQSLTYEDGENGMKRISNVSDGNRSLNFSYKSGTNLLEKVSDPLGRSIKFGYELNSNTGRYQLTSFKDAKNQETTYIYGNQSRKSKLLTKIQLPKGNYIENQYDSNRRLTQTDNGTSKTTVNVNTTYGSNGTSASTTSHVEVTRGNSVVSAYNYAFNDNNVMTSMSGPQNFSVSSTYYTGATNCHLPQSITTNSTNISNIEYDDKGNILRMDVTGDGQTLTTKMTYDSMNNLKSVTDPNNNETTYSYDSRGNLTGISAPENVSTSIYVNSKGLPTSITNPMNVVTQFEYNKYGNLTKTTLPALGLSTSSSYDEVSRLISSTDALERTTTFTYDKNDNMIKEIDADNHPTIYDYDANDNLYQITNAKGGVTSMSYDNVTDWLTSVSFAGATKQYDYNKDGTLSTYTKPDGTKLNYSYDKLGRVKDDGINTYSYDSQTLNLTSIKSKTSGKTLTFSYDGFNRITGTSYNGHSNSYTYDKNGNCLSVNGVSYTYDGLNRLKTVKFNGKTITYTYRKDSQLSSVSYPNGMTTTFGYDNVGRLTSKKTKLGNGTVIANYTFELDNVGNIVSQTAQEPYEGINLTDEEISYTYNSGNRITQAGDISFEFDENGNTTWRGSEQYQWDKSDRLTKAGSTSLTYDPLGYIASYGDITFTIDPLGIGNVLSDSDGAEYIYGNGLEGRVKNGKTSYYVTDFRGSVVAIVDESGNVTHKYQYDEFGKVTQKEEADYNPFQYVGKYGVMALNDHQYYMRARHYDPTIGRFISEDPIWSTNLYPYTENNPIMGIDPRGLTSLEAQLAEAKKSYSRLESKWESVGNYIDEHRGAEDIEKFRDLYYQLIDKLANKSIEIKELEAKIKEEQNNQINIVGFSIIPEPSKEEIPSHQYKINPEGLNFKSPLRKSDPIAASNKPYEDILMWLSNSGGKVCKWTPYNNWACEN